MFQKCQSAFFKLYFAIFMSIIMSVSILTYCHGLGVHSFLSSFCCSFFITLAIMNTLDMPLPGRLLAGKLGVADKPAGFFVVNGVTGFIMAFIMNFSMNAVQTGFDATFLPRFVGTLPAAIPASIVGSIIATWLAEKLAGLCKTPG